MDAKLFQVPGSMEIRLKNKKSYLSEEGEDQKAFVDRISYIVKTDLGVELKLKITKVENLAKYSVPQLTKALAKATGVEAKMIQLAIDNQTPKDAPKASAKTATKSAAKKATPKAKAAPKAAAKKAVAKAKPKAKAAAAKKADGAKPKQAAKKSAAKAKPKQVAKKAATKSKVRKPSANKPEAPSQAAIAKLKKRVGEELTFTPFRSKKELTGIIKQVTVDKRVNLAYFRVHVGKGVKRRLYHVRTNRA